VPQSETQLSVPTVCAEVTIVKDISGQVTHLKLRIQGMDSQAKKIKWVFKPGQPMKIDHKKITASEHKLQCEASRHQL